MTPDALLPEIAGLDALLADARARGAALAAIVTRPEVLAAFFVGAGTVFSGARLVLLAAVLMAGAQLAVGFGHLAELPGWLLPVCLALAVIGVVQGIVTVLASAETFGDLLLMVLALAATLLVFLLWKGPVTLAARAFAGRGRP